MRKSPAVATMFRALLPAATAGEDVALKFRSRISIASRSGMCVEHQDEMVGEMLMFLAVHVDHSSECPYHATAVAVVKRLTEIGIDNAESFVNNPHNPEVRTE